MVYTVADIPMWSLNAVISPNHKERTSIISLISMFSFIGLITASAATMPLLIKLGGPESPESYSKVALVFGIFCVISMSCIFFFTKERVESKKEKISIKDSFSTITQNKPLLLIILSFLLIISLLTITQGIMVFFAEYNLGDSKLVTTLTFALFIPLLFGTGLTGIIANKIGKKKTYIISSVLRALAALIYYFIGYQNLTLVYVFMGLNGFFMAFPAVLLTSMIADSVDFSEWKTGIRSEGLVFSMRTFTAKLGSAVGGGLSALLLGFYHFVPKQAIQSPETLQGIFNIFSLFTFIAVLVSLIPILFYDLPEEKLLKIKEELRGSDA